MKYTRDEYPRPQFRREDWMNLNGKWDFDFFDGVGASFDVTLSKKINVPFSYQWEASGIYDRTQHDTVVYRRTFEISEENKGRRALLCFNGVDYFANIYINGRFVCNHKGGFTPFNSDITDFLVEGENTIAVVCVDTLDNAVPRGKQSWKDKPFTCFYYPNSGIWQSVWLEFFENDCIESHYLTANFDERSIGGYIETKYSYADALKIDVKFQGKRIKSSTFSLNGKRTRFSISLDGEGFDFEELRWWIDHPNLLYVDFTLLKKDCVCDIAHTRIGMRKISVENGVIMLNNIPLYQRLILDQGYWKESGLTPPSAEALKQDILLAKAMGFNGARKHQKVEDPYFYYYAEELGFIVWCEMPSAYTFCEREAAAISNEWQEIVNYAKNFTSVITYVPLNESWGVGNIKADRKQQNFARSLYYLTKSIDDTRIVSTNDGFETIEESDILSIHDYDVKRKEEFPIKYNGTYDGMHPQGSALFADGHKYKGQPVLLTEFGGIAFVDEQKGSSWGYGNGAKNADELLTRLSELLQGITQSQFQGYCYTQLTDVEQEVNGLLYADRTPKCDVEKLKKIFDNKR